ncbi:MAG: sugar phosphate isomerase/epimerase, partial [Planctomycetes bacterium]|nr:sugar phosphate isomerase/epimerase [Planctomycetota bacterium]
LVTREDYGVRHRRCRFASPRSGPVAKTRPQYGPTRNVGKDQGNALGNGVPPNDSPEGVYYAAATRRGFLAAAGLGLAAARAGAAEQQKPSGWQVGCWTRPWDKHEYRVALDAIAEAGFKHGGLMTTKGKSNLVISTATTPEEAQQVGEEVKKRGLSVPCAYCGGFPLGEPGVAALKKLIDCCVAATSKALMVGGTGDAKSNDAYYKTIADACPYAAEKGIEIVLKPHGGLNATGPQCRKCVEMVGHKCFRLWYDPGNIFFYSNGELDPAKDAATVDGLVTGVCIKDYKHPKNVAVTPGTGQVDFKAVLALLKKGGFTAGPLVIETLTPGELPALLAEARKARKFVEDVIQGMDG